MARKKSPLSLTEMALALERKKQEVVQQAATDLAFRLANGEDIENPEIQSTLENLKEIGPARRRGRKPGSRNRSKEIPNKPVNKIQPEPENEIELKSKQQPVKATEKPTGQFLNDEDY